MTVLGSLLSVFLLPVASPRTSPPFAQEWQHALLTIGLPLFSLPLPLVYRIFHFLNYLPCLNIEDQFEQSLCSVLVKRFIVAPTFRRLHTRRTPLRTPALTDDVKRRTQQFLQPVKRSLRDPHPARISVVNKHSRFCRIGVIGVGHAPQIPNDPRLD